MRIKVNIPWIDVEYSETNPLIVIYVYMFGDRYQVFRFASVSMMTLSSQFLSASSDERNFRFNSVLLSHSDASSLLDELVSSLRWVPICNVYDRWRLWRRYKLHTIFFTAYKFVTRSSLSVRRIFLYIFLSFVFCQMFHNMRLERFSIAHKQHVITYA